MMKQQPGGKKSTGKQRGLITLKPLPDEPYVPKFDALEFAKRTGSFGQSHQSSLFAPLKVPTQKKKKKAKAKGRSSGGGKGRGRGPRRGEGGQQQRPPPRKQAAAASASSPSSLSSQYLSRAAAKPKPKPATATTKSASSSSSASAASSGSSVFGAPLMERRGEVVGLSLRHIERGLASRSPVVARSTLASLARLHTMFGRELSLHAKMTGDASPTLAALERQLRRHAAFRRIACAADARAADAGVAPVAAQEEARAAVYARCDPDHAKEFEGLVATLKLLALDGNASARALLERRFDDE